ncbi:TPA: hypothetical protein DDZ86_02915 [Candidatus Dependentiae bacterium]|nr:MAG: hypothetical protein UW09_C0001G0062 [candidate division TM6 bacterium GW2011_GWF2_43_87]HBL98571.1 hypothetical protein [Candidatus Dependentiae bacterium]
MKKIVGLVWVALIACGARGATWSDVNFIQPLKDFVQEVTDKVGILPGYWSKERANSYMHLYVQFDTSKDTMSGEIKEFGTTYPAVSSSDFLNPYPTTPPDYKDTLAKLANVDVLKWLKTKENRNIFLNELGKYLFADKDRVKTVEELCAKLDLTQTGVIPTAQFLLDEFADKIKDSFFGRLFVDSKAVVPIGTTATVYCVVKIDNAKKAQVAEAKETAKVFNSLSTSLGSIAKTA